MIERRVHAIFPSISLIESINPFRLIEHQIRPIVNGITVFQQLS
jgi:hypothetical protein